MHDLSYVYGFNEESGNFQNNNFGKGGKDGDGIIAQAQDRSGENLTHSDHIPWYQFKSLSFIFGSLFGGYLNF